VWDNKGKIIIILIIGGQNHQAKALIALPKQLNSLYP
jgi:hypothetical protein